MKKQNKPKTKTLTPSKTLVWPKIIPPKSVVRLVRNDRRSPAMQEDVGRKFRVGYYSPQDGLDCIWLVNEAAEYEQTADRQWLCDYFVLEWLSKETDYFGWTRPKLRKLTKSTLKSRGKRKKRKGGK